MALTVLDAGVVIALLDANDVHHASAMRTMRLYRDRQDDLVLPASAYAETLVAPYRTSANAVATVNSFLDALPARVEPINRAIAGRAAEFRAKHKALRLPDALVIATAVALEADALLTTDRRWPKLDVHVEVI